jgi:hypothetical protein
VRLRVGVIVDLRVPGRIVRRLDARRLTVRNHRRLELLLVNRGNVTERLGRDGLRLVLSRDGRPLARLRPLRGELLPRSSGLAEFVYRGPARGGVVARIELRPSIPGRRPAFHLRLWALEPESPYADECRVDRRVVWIFVAVGTTLGGLAPLMWGGSTLGLASLALAGLGGIAGVWCAAKLTG